MYYTHCLGFAFDEALENVVVLRKNRPERFKGQLNGLGGKLEPGETGLEAMVREFKEECGLRTVEQDWGFLGELECGNDRVACYAARLSTLVGACTQESEEILVLSVAELQLKLWQAQELSRSTDIGWLVHFARRALLSGQSRPIFLVSYENSTAWHRSPPSVS